MAITQAHLTDAVSNPFGGHAATTAAFTPSVNKLQLLKLWVQTSFADPTPLTVSTTTGLTWVQVANVVLTGNYNQTYVYRAMKPSGLSSGTVNFTFTGFIDVFQWSIDEFDGVDTSGTDGSGSVVQSATGSDASINLFADATLAAFGSANNGTYMGGGAYDGSGLLSGFTATGGFTNINAVVQSSKWGDATYWRADNSTACRLTPTDASGAPRTTVVSLEIKAAAAVEGPELLEARRMMSVP